MPQPRPAPTREGTIRIARSRLIGGILGMVTSAIILLWGIGFLGKHHSLGIAIIVTVAYVLVMSWFNLWLYRRTMARAEGLVAAGPVSPIS